MTDFILPQEAEPINSTSILWSFLLLLQDCQSCSGSIKLSFLGNLRNCFKVSLSKAANHMGLGEKHDKVISISSYGKWE